MTGALRVPDAIGDLRLELMLQGKVVRYSVSFRAPGEGADQDTAELAAA